MFKSRVIYMEDKRTSRRKLGDLGENIACKFLVKRGFKVIERNYLKKWGEIDIIATKGGVLHFVEVKSVKARNVPQETSHRPEDNVHPAKLARLARTMQTYMVERRMDGDFQLDVITVKIDESTRTARVEIIENIII